MLINALFFLKFALSLENLRKKGKRKKSFTYEITDTRDKSPYPSAALNENKIHNKLCWLSGSPTSMGDLYFSWPKDGGLFFSSETSLRGERFWIKRQGDIFFLIGIGYWMALWVSFLSRYLVLCMQFYCQRSFDFSFWNVVDWLVFFLTQPDK